MWLYIISSALLFLTFLQSVPLVWQIYQQTSHLMKVKTYHKVQ